MLAIIGGPAGAHEFYLGNRTWGWLYLMFTVIALSLYSYPIGFYLICSSLILTVIDVCGLLFTTEKEFQRKYNSEE